MRRGTRKPVRAEEGMALLTVLMLVGVMGALTAATLEVMSRSVAVTANSRAGMQAHQYARGAALIAASRLEALLDQADGRLTLAGGWADTPFTVPTAGGSITVTLSDASHCFNVNALAPGAAGRPGVINPIAARQFTTLAESVGIGQRRAEGMTMSLVDFIDGDPYPQAGGGEDNSYAGYTPPNRPLAGVGELMAVLNWRASDYELLRPYLCALPTSEMQEMNINTMTEADAPLVAMLAAGRLSPARARQAIAQRPAAGWENVADFLNAPSPPISGEANIGQALGVDSDLFTADIVVDEGGFTVRETVLIRMDERGPQILERRWGAA